VLNAGRAWKWPVGYSRLRFKAAPWGCRGLLAAATVSVVADPLRHVGAPSVLTVGDPDDVRVRLNEPPKGA
jgi:hypothetical protein